MPQLLGKLNAKGQAYAVPLNEYRKLDRNNDRLVLLACFCAQTNRSQTAGESEFTLSDSCIHRA